MHHDTTLDQAVAQLDALFDEWRDLLRLMANPGLHAPSDRIQVLALEALEAELRETIGAVQYRRQQARDMTQVINTPAELPAGPQRSTS